jgi:hypothetical protein
LFLLSGVGKDPVSKDNAWAIGYRIPDLAVLLGMAGPRSVSVATIQYPRFKVDFPNRRISKKAIRLPRPDLITPFATKKAAKISSMKLSEKPEKAFSGVSTPNKTTATNARTDAVKIERASIKTPMMAVIKMANKYQAFGERSQGIGRCQIIIPNTSVITLFIQRNFW